MAENKMEPLYFWIQYFNEHINTSCVELDGLDCREVLALLQELAAKKVDKPNKMAEVAALKGKELNEPFMIESRVHKVNIKVRFTENGMEYFDDSCGRWYPTDAFMTELLTGQAVIVNE
jgi:hypothetical protein